MRGAYLMLLFHTQNNIRVLLDGFAFIISIGLFFCMNTYILRNRIFRSAFGKNAHKRKKKKEILKNISLLQRITLRFVLECHNNNLDIIKRTRKELTVYYVYIFLTIILIICCFVRIIFPFFQPIVSLLGLIWVIYMMVVLWRFY